MENLFFLFKILSLLPLNNLQLYYNLTNTIFRSEFGPFFKCFKIQISIWPVIKQQVLTSGTLFLKKKNWLEDDCFIVLCWFLYNRRESAVSIHMSPPSRASLPPALPSLGRHGAAGWAPCVPQQPPLAGYFTHGGVRVSALLSQFVHSLLLPLCPQVHSLHLHLCSCPANRSMGTIFRVLMFKCLVQ